MTAHTMRVMRRPRRRTHLIGEHPLCGTTTAQTDATFVTIELIGGATTRLRNTLMRELDGNTCIPCTRIALGMLALYASRDTGKAW